MKVLSLDQPWATLIVLGVKTIETRSWKAPAALIGQRFAIAATARVPKRCKVGDYRPSLGREIGATWEIWAEARHLRHVNYPLPLGVIVATARLFDCAPMADAHDDAVRPLLQIDTDDGGQALTYWGRNRPGWPYEQGTRLTAQLPYGHFAAGRWAWMLTDVEPLPEPVPFKGGQGLSRSWEPTQTAEVIP